MRHFVTLHNFQYLDKAIAMIQSLLSATQNNVKIHVYTLDTVSWLAYQHLNLRGLVALHPNQWLNRQLLQLRAERSVADFCFTCTPFVVEHCMITTGAEIVTYVDADTFFFNDPEIGFREMGDADIVVVPHNFPDFDYVRLIGNGRYNVNFLSFRKSAKAIEVLCRWRDQCAERCDARSVGDQKYLDEWDGLLGNRLHKFESPGLYAAPWNASIHDFGPGPTVDGEPLVYWHMHEFQRRALGNYKLSGYKIPEEAKTYIYQPYINAIEEAQDFIKRVGAKC